VLLAAFAAPEPARGGAPAPPPPWAHAGPKPEKFTRTVEDGKLQEVWAQNGQAHGPAVVFNKAGAKIREEFYERDRCWRRKDWYDDGRWKYYADWDGQGQTTYQVHFGEDGRRTMEAGCPTPDTSPDVPRFGQDSIAPALRARADAYIVAKVGRDYFAKNYRFLRGHSEFYAETPTCGRYFLRYEYAPLLKIGSDGMVTVELYDGDGAHIDPARRSYVATVEQGRVVEPTITRAQALDLAAARFPKIPREWMHPVVVTPGWFWGEKLRSFTWAVYVNLQPPGSDHVNNDVVFVDTVTGQYAGRSEQAPAR
jgi:hypothetical protein